MERLLIAIAGVCGIASAVLLLTSHLDAAFVVGALGAVAWFLGFRVRIRKSIAPIDEATGEGPGESQESDEN